MKARVGIHLVIVVVVTLYAAGCSRPLATAPPASPVVSGSSAQVANTSADFEAAKLAVLAHSPHWSPSALKADLTSYADLDAIGWWATHKSAPYKSIRVWSPITSSSGAIATPANSHIWDVVQTTSASSWTVVSDSESSE